MFEEFNKRIGLVSKVDDGAFFVFILSLLFKHIILMKRPLEVLTLDTQQQIDPIHDV